MYRIEVITSTVSQQYQMSNRDVQFALESVKREAIRLFGGLTYWLTNGAYHDGATNIQLDEHGVNFLVMSDTDRDARLFADYVRIAFAQRSVVLLINQVNGDCVESVHSDSTPTVQCTMPGCFEGQHSHWPKNGADYCRWWPERAEVEVSK